MGFQIYKYYPCADQQGNVVGVPFESNVENEFNPQLAGQTITFPDLFPGACFSILLEGPSITPIPVDNYYTIDWDTEPYTLYTNCPDCIAAVNYVDQCLCSTVTNTGLSESIYRYVDCVGEGQIINVGPGETSTKICLQYWLPNDDAQYTFYGDCIGDKCPSLFRLTDCNDPSNTICTNTNLQSYFDNQQSITLFGYPGICWTIEPIAECVNPVAVVVQGSFINCPTCLQNFVTNYQLINCENSSIIIYTSVDLSDYVDRVVKLDVYGNDCWFVRVINSAVPVDTPVNVTESFEDCEECNSNYYLLEDCNPLALTQPIVTITDLSQYVGQVITLETCPEICWTVSETDYVSNYQTVILENNFEDCEECISQQPCYCITFNNNTDTPVSIDVIDCNAEYTKINLLPGESIEKICLTFWSSTESVQISNSGLCVDKACPPDPVRRKRKVTPGYNTPVCSTEYYEKVVCNFSEWMYKDVLNKRYGISNCCPEDLLKWQIKYEKLMLDVLINPDYTCTSTTDCCGPNITLNYNRDCNS